MESGNYLYWTASPSVQKKHNHNNNQKCDSDRYDVRVRGRSIALAIFVDRSYPYLPAIGRETRHTDRFQDLTVLFVQAAHVGSIEFRTEFRVLCQLVVIGWLVWDEFDKRVLAFHTQLFTDLHVEAILIRSGG